jgi:hypothetical protein
MNNVFISYRSEIGYVADRISERIARKFGKRNVFKYVDSTKPGQDFRGQIREALARCEVLLVIIGRGWLTRLDAEGRTRLDDARDFVRIEVEAALERKIPIIPLLVDGSTVPADDELPASMKGLSYQTGIPVRPDPDFDGDMERLLAALDDIRRRPSATGKLVGPAVAVAGVLGVIVAVATAGRFLPRPDPVPIVIDKKVDPSKSSPPERFEKYQFVFDTTTDDKEGGHLTIIFSSSKSGEFCTVPLPGEAWGKHTHTVKEGDVKDIADRLGVDVPEGALNARLILTDGPGVNIGWNFNVQLALFTNRGRHFIFSQADARLDTTGRGEPRSSECPVPYTGITDAKGNYLSH